MKNNQNNHQPMSRLSRLTNSEACKRARKKQEDRLLKQLCYSERRFQEGLRLQIQNESLLKFI